MYTTRILAHNRYAIQIDADSTSSSDFAARVPPHVEWPAQNYNNLHEQPTVFYAVALTLAVCGVRDGATEAAAWAYVALRVAHSLVQATRNVIVVRFGVFVASSCVLVGLTATAVVRVLALEG